MEKVGIPTLTIVTSAFSSLADNTAAGEGAPSWCKSVIEHPVGGISEAQVRANVDKIWPDIKAKLTGWKPQASTAAASAQPYPLKTFKVKGDEATVNEFMSRRHYTMSLPVILPTKERVEKMLTGTTRAPSEVLGKVGPRDGVLTVELVAVHAVMAGCKPEYMPAIIAACEALLDPAVNWRGCNTSTGSLTMLIVYNGPIVKKLGSANSVGAAGASQPVNNRIGYCLSLIAEVVGGSFPGVDMSNLGAPSDLVAWVVGEDEAHLPKGWDSFAVSRGFGKDESVVTVAGVYPGVDHMDHSATTLDRYLEGFRSVTGMGGIFRSRIGYQGTDNKDITPIIIFSPELLNFASDNGLDRAAFQKAFWEKTSLPLKYLAGINQSQLDIFAKRYGIEITPDTMIPQAMAPEDLCIVVSGGMGKHAHLFTPFGGCASRVVGN